MGKAQIKFGTDAWRAIIADDYTVENVQRVAEATAKWMKNNKLKRVVIGHDCRFGRPPLPATINEVEVLIPETPSVKLPTL